MTWMQIGQLAAIGTAMLWTLSTLAWTSAGRRIGALSVSFLRLIVACALLAGWGQISRGLWLPTDASRETWLLLGISGLFGFFLADLCLFKAYLLIGPRLSLLIQSLTPPLAAVISSVFLDDPLGLKHWLAMAVTLSGVAWVMLERPDAGHQRPTGHLAGGICLSLVAAVAQAIGLVLSKRGLGNYDPVAATFIRILGAMVGYVVLVTLVRRWTVIAANLRHARVMGLILCGAILGPVVGVVLCMVALRYCHAGVTATIIGTMPVLILPFVVVLYREPVSLRAVAGAIVSVAGVAMLML
jgi:drug/metabolite transporter (DMT)-like permease